MSTIFSKSSPVKPTQLTFNLHKASINVENDNFRYEISTGSGFRPGNCGQTHIAVTEISFQRIFNMKMGDFLSRALKLDDIEPSVVEWQVYAHYHANLSFLINFSMTLSSLIHYLVLPYAVVAYTNRALVNVVVGNNGEILDDVRLTFNNANAVFQVGYRPQPGIPPANPDELAWANNYRGRVIRDYMPPATVGTQMFNYKDYLNINNHLVAGVAQPGDHIASDATDEQAAQFILVSFGPEIGPMGTRILDCYPTTMMDQITTAIDQQWFLHNNAYGNTNPAQDGYYAQLDQHSHYQEMQVMPSLIWWQWYVNYAQVARRQRNTTLAQLLFGEDQNYILGPITNVFNGFERLRHVPLWEHSAFGTISDIDSDIPQSVERSTYHGITSGLLSQGYVGTTRLPLNQFTSLRDAPKTDDDDWSMCAMLPWSNPECTTAPNAPLPYPRDLAFLLDDTLRFPISYAPKYYNFFQKLWPGILKSSAQRNMSMSRLRQAIDVTAWMRMYLDKYVQSAALIVRQTYKEIDRFVELKQTPVARNHLFFMHVCHAWHCLNFPFRSVADIPAPRTGYAVKLRWLNTLWRQRAAVTAAGTFNQIQAVPFHTTNLGNFYQYITPASYSNPAAQPNAVYVRSGDEPSYRNHVTTIRGDVMPGFDDIVCGPIENWVLDYETPTTFKIAAPPQGHFFSEIYPKAYTASGIYPILDERTVLGYNVGAVHAPVGGGAVAQPTLWRTLLRCTTCKVVEKYGSDGDTAATQAATDLQTVFADGNAFDLSNTYQRFVALVSTSSPEIGNETAMTILNDNPAVYYHDNVTAVCRRLQPNRSLFNHWIHPRSGFHYLHRFVKRPVQELCYSSADISFVTPFVMLHNDQVMSGATAVDATNGQYQNLPPTLDFLSYYAGGIGPSTNLAPTACGWSWISDNVTFENILSRVGAPTPQLVSRLVPNAVRYVPDTNKPAAVPPNYVTSSTAADADFGQEYPNTANPAIFDVYQEHYAIPPSVEYHIPWLDQYGGRFIEYNIMRGDALWSEHSIALYGKRPNLINTGILATTTNGQYSNSVTRSYSRNLVDVITNMFLSASVDNPAANMTNDLTYITAWAANCPLNVPFYLHENVIHNRFDYERMSNDVRQLRDITMWETPYINPLLDMHRVKATVQTQNYSSEPVDNDLGRVYHHAYNFGTPAYVNAPQIWGEVTAANDRIAARLHMPAQNPQQAFYSTGSTAGTASNEALMRLVDTYGWTSSSRYPYTRPELEVNSMPCYINIHLPADGNNQQRMAGEIDYNFAGERVRSILVGHLADQDSETPMAVNLCPPGADYLPQYFPQGTILVSTLSPSAYNDRPEFMRFRNTLNFINSELQPDNAAVTLPRVNVAPTHRFLTHNTPERQNQRHNIGYIEGIEPRIWGIDGANLDNPYRYGAASPPATAWTLLRDYARERTREVQVRENVIYICCSLAEREAITGKQMIGKIHTEIREQVAIDAINNPSIPPWLQTILSTYQFREVTKIHNVTHANLNPLIKEMSNNPQTTIEIWFETDVGRIPSQEIEQYDISAFLTNFQITSTDPYNRNCDVYM